MARAETVFLDTNVVIAALLSPTGGSARVITEYGATFRLLINDHILDELLDVFQRKFTHRPGLESQLFGLLAVGNIDVLPTPPLSKFRYLYRLIEKKDAPILASALKTSDYLLSLDEDFLNDAVREYATKRGLTICTPGEFLNRTRVT